MADALLLRREGAVLLLINNNPRRRNALSAGFYAAAIRALREAQADPGIGAVLLTGTGNFFCAGGDLDQLAARRAMAPAQRRQHLEPLHDLIRAIRASGKPVIAAVEGGAAGAGLSLALACDMLVAARDAKFSASYVRVGLTPDGGLTSLLAECVSRQLLTELCLGGEPIDAGRLYVLGAINRLAEPGAAEAVALILARRLSLGPAQAMASIKTLCRQAHAQTLDAQLEQEAHHMVAAQGGAEAAEGIAAFLDKRAPDFVALRSHIPSKDPQ